MATAREPCISSEELLSRKYDRCIANSIVKGGIGISVGIGLSFLFFKRRAWPIALSTGFGLGVAYNECERSFNPHRQLGQTLEKK